MLPTLPSRSVEVIGAESSVFIVMNAVSFLGNMMVCLAVYRNPRIRATTHIYILALAVSDLLCALGSMPFTVTAIIAGQWIFGETVCEIQAFIVYFVLNISPSTMGLAALSRYMRIVKTCNYNTTFSKRRSKIILASVWLSLVSYLIVARCTSWWKFTFYSAYATCVVSHNSDERKLIHSAVIIPIYFVLPLSVAMFSYFHVYRTIRHHNLDIVPALQNKTRQARITLHEIKISKSIFWVIAGFLLCWLPMWSVAIVLRFFPQANLDQFVQLLPMFLLYLSCTINPFIYASSNRAYKREFQRILTICKSKTCSLFHKSHRIKPVNSAVEQN